ASLGAVVHAPAVCRPSELRVSGGRLPIGARHRGRAGEVYDPRVGDGARRLRGFPWARPAWRARQPVPRTAPAAILDALARGRHGLRDAAGSDLATVPRTGGPAATRGPAGPRAVPHDLARFLKVLRPRPERRGNPSGRATATHPARLTLHPWQCSQCSLVG